MSGRHLLFHLRRSTADRGDDHGSSHALRQRFVVGSLAPSRRDTCFALRELSDLHPVRSVSAGFSRHLRAGWPVEFVLSHSLFILWRIEDNEMVDKVTRRRRRRA